jgi:hypothetical protein
MFWGLVLLSKHGINPMIATISDALVGDANTGILPILAIQNENSLPKQGASWSQMILVPTPPAATIYLQ